MNLALGAVFLAILLIAPLITLYFYGTGNHARQMPKVTLIEYFLISAVLSLLLHSLIIWSFDLNVDFKFIFQLLSGQMTKDDFKVYEPILEKYFFDFALYTFLTCCAATVLGLLFQIIATSRRLRMVRYLQRKRGNSKPDKFFGYYNDWWYFFKFNEYSSEFDYFGMEKPIIYIDVIVNTNDLTVLYSGMLLDFVLKEQNLEFIYINGVKKRSFTQKDTNEAITLQEGAEFNLGEPGAGGMMCIPYSNIINLYIRFVVPPKIDRDYVEGATPVSKN